MMLWISLAIRNARRNLRRTLLTAATVVFGVAMMVLGMAWIEGIFGQMISLYTAQSGHVRVLDGDYAQREELQPLYENIEDAAAVEDAITEVDGVTYVAPRIVVGAVITADEEIGEDFTMVVGAPQDYFTGTFAGPDHLVDGQWLTGEAGEVVLGAKIAGQIGAAVGDEVLLLGQTQYGSMSPMAAQVVGIVSGDASLRQQAFVTLEDAQWMLDLEGGALELLVWAEDDEPETGLALASRIASLEGMDGYLAQAWIERSPWNMMIGMIGVLQGFLQGILVFITALAIFNTMTVSVLERTREIGVMRAMGLTRVGAVGMFVVEAIAIGLLGGVVGAALGAVPSAYLEAVGVTMGADIVDATAGTGFPMTETFYADMNPEIFVNGVLIGVAMAVMGALLPSLRAAAIRPVVAMRARR